jgi:hypothetical protein
VVAVKEVTSAYAVDVVPTLAPSSGRGRPPKPRYHDDPSNLHDLALAAGQDAFVEVTWRHGTRKTRTNPTAAMTSTFLAIKVRPANRDIPRNPDGSLPTRWLLVEWPDDAKQPTDYWLSNLDDDNPTRRTRPPGQDPLAHRTRLPRTENRPRPGPLRRP